MLGKLNFYITDPPPVVPTRRPINPRGQTNAQGGPQTVIGLDLTVRKVEVHLAHLIPFPTGSQAGLDKWETLNIGGTQTVDLVALAKNSNLSLLGVTSLAAGQYTEIRLYVSAGSATLPDGTKVTLTLLGKDNIVKIVEPFTITAGKTNVLTVDFAAQRSVIKAGSRYLLRPVVAQLITQ